MKNLLLISTGGTIACGNTENGLLPSMSGKNLLSFIQNVDEMCKITVLDLMSVDSSAMKKEDRQKIADTVREKADEYDGFIITHGTDTLAYTSALLTYLLHDIKKPIVITGAQKPIDQKGTDAAHNLELAIKCACEEFRGVCVAWQDEIIDGAAASKIRTDGLFVIKSVNEKPVGKLNYDGDIELSYSENRYSEKPKITEFNTNFAIIKLFPDLDPSVLEKFFSCYALILEGFGTGGLPDGFIPYIKTLLDKNVKVYVKSQTAMGGSNLSLYAQSAKALDVGVLDCAKLTTENIVARIMCGII